MSNPTVETAGAVPPWAAGTAERMHELDPELSTDEIELIKSYGEVQEFPPNSLLWSAGDQGPMMLVLEGGIEVFRKTPDGDAIIISHGPGHYIGETVTMSGNRALVSGRSTDETLTAVVLHSDDVRRLIAGEADLGEKLLLSFMLRRMRMIAENLGNITLIGDPAHADSASLQRFLSRNGVPFSIHTPDVSNGADELLTEHDLQADDLPAVGCKGEVLVQPSEREVAEYLGFTAQVDCGTEYDVAIIGSGPAGMAAAVYAASEGLKVVVLERCAPGGQAGSSSKIENYMGFPTGISGQALMGRAYLQAQKFGASIAIARELLELERGDQLHKLRLDGGDIVYARSVVIGSGAVYRQPQLDNLENFGGVHYGASHVESQLCRGKDVAIVGGGNSAGQAAVFLANHTRNVYILIRGESLAASMSDYLIQRIDRIPNVHLMNFSEVDSINGEHEIESLSIRNNHDGSISDLAAAHLFIFIGASPGTSFVEDAVALDDKGFVLTGDQLDDQTLAHHGWPEQRRPYLLETSCPRVFAAGDVRSGSVKRVASAVGEGSVCVQFIHKVLAELEAAG